MGIIEAGGRYHPKRLIKRTYNKISGRNGSISTLNRLNNLTRGIQELSETALPHEAPDTQQDYIYTRNKAEIALYNGKKIRVIRTYTQDSAMKTTSTEIRVLELAKKPREIRLTRKTKSGKITSSQLKFGKYHIERSRLIFSGKSYRAAERYMASLKI